jgi:hypothetical protein
MKRKMKTRLIILSVLMSVAAADGKSKNIYIIQEKNQ